MDSEGKKNNDQVLCILKIGEIQKVVSAGYIRRKIEVFSDACQSGGIVVQNVFQRIYHGQSGCEGREFLSAQSTALERSPAVVGVASNGIYMLRVD